MLGRRTNTIPTLGQHLVFAGTYPQANTREDICFVFQKQIIHFLPTL